MQQGQHSALTKHVYNVPAANMTLPSIIDRTNPNMNAGLLL